MKYLSSRYQLGVKKVHEFMQRSQRYIDIVKLPDALPDAIEFLSTLPAAESLIIMIVDMTVWPSRHLQADRMKFLRRSHVGRRCHLGMLRNGSGR